MAQRRETETVVVDELAAIVANSRKTSKLVSRFAEDYERLGQDRSTMPEFEAIEEARIEAGLQELTSAARLLSVAWGSPESHRRLAAITARAGEARPSSSSAPTCCGIEPIELGNAALAALRQYLSEHGVPPAVSKPVS